MVEEHGNEDLVRAIVGSLNPVIERLNAATEKLSKSENFLKSTEEEALRRDIQEFLTSADMKPFVDTYGTIDGKLTDAQTTSQMALFQQADDLSAGAKDHGKAITTREALESAHLILSVGTRDQAIREEIRDAMKKRTKTLPSSHEQSPSAGEEGDITDEELEKRTAARMQAMRNK